MMQDNFDGNKVGGQNCGCGNCAGAMGKWRGGCVKNTVGAVMIVLALFLIAETVGVIKSYKFIGSNPTSSGTITVSGKGEIVAKPDIAEFSFSATEESLVVSEAQDKVAKEINDITAFLKKSGIADKDIKTTNYSVYPRYDYVKASDYPYGGKQELAAYVVTQTTNIKVRTISDAGKIITGIGELGAKDVSGLSFTNDKIDDLREQAKAKAIALAKTNADKLASELGVQLVRVVSYSDGGNYPMPMYEKAAYGMGGGVASAPTVPAISTGENTITSNVSITYEIK